jgi:hypothetical protein
LFITVHQHFLDINRRIIEYLDLRGMKRQAVGENCMMRLHGLYSSPGIIRVIRARRMRLAGHVACMGEVRGAYNILVGRPEGRRPLGRPR